MNMYEPKNNISFTTVVTTHGAHTTCLLEADTKTRASRAARVTTGTRACRSVAGHRDRAGFLFFGGTIRRATAFRIATIDWVYPITRAQWMMIVSKGLVQKW